MSTLTRPTARERLDNLILDLLDLKEDLDRDPRKKQWQEKLRPALNGAIVELDTVREDVWKAG